MSLQWCHMTVPFTDAVSYTVLSTVTFDDCMGNKAVVFQSSDPSFGVRTDGSIFAREESASIDNPVQFRVSAHGLDSQVWETVVQLSLNDPPSLQSNGNEVSLALAAHEHRHRIQLSCQSFFLLSNVLQRFGDSGSQESGQNSVGFFREAERL